MRIIKYFFVSSLFVVLVWFFSIYWFTWLFQAEEIDARDLQYWDYKDWIIEWWEKIEFEWSKDSCWLMLHWYTSVPNEYYDLAKKVNNKFWDYVFVPRLKWHWKTPSKLADLDLFDWYEQARWYYSSISKDCKKVNLVWFSFGWNLAMRLAQNPYDNLDWLYLLAPYLKARFFNFDYLPIDYFDYISWQLNYWKKINIAQINKDSWKEEHIAYWNFPFSPIINSHEFVDNTRKGLDKIEVPTLIQHSYSDRTVDIQWSYYIYEQISSEKKDFIKYTDSNHILLRDYDKKDVMNEIIEFYNNL